MNELYLIKSGDNGFVEETSAVISADSGEISINDSLYVESAGNIGIGSSNPVNKLDVVGSASISNNLTVGGITFSNVGGQAPNEANDIIMYDGTDWVVAAASQLPGGGGGAGNSAVPAGLINALTEGDAIHEVTFGYDASGVRIAYDNVPKIAASLEIDGAGEIIPHTVSGVSESGYFVVFSEELPTANYRMHTVFGGTDAFWETGVANLEYSDRNVEINRSLYVGQKVGIGTTNPSMQLQIKNQSATSNKAQIGLTSLDGSQNASITHIDEGAVERLSLSCGGFNLEQLTLMNSGNVGIGTTNPDRNLVVDAGVNSSPFRLIARDSDQTCAIQIRNSDNNQTITQLGANIDSYFTGGNVGIGTTNPSNGKLEILNPTSTIATTDSVDLAITQNASATSSKVQLRSGVTSGDNPYFAIRTRNNNSASSEPGLIKERMRITSAGNVGIGATNPFARLGVEIATNSNLTTGVFVRNNSSHSGSGGSNIAAFHGPNDYAMQVKCDGRVGIGTTSPIAKLNVANITADSNAFTISRAENAAISLFSIFQDSSWDIGGGQGSGIAHINTNNRNLAITTSSDQSLDGGIFIDESGKVGIGATSPNTSLHVTSPAGNGDGTVFIENTLADYGMGLKVKGGGNIDNERFALTVQNAAGDDILFAQSKTGNVGIGTTNPTSRFQVEEPASTNQTTGLFVRNQSTQTANGGATIAGFHNASDYVMQIKTNGRVGIGTTNPIYKFDVREDAATWAAYIRNNNSDPYGLSIQYPTSAPSGTSNHFLRCYLGGSSKFSVSSNGNVVSNTNSYTSDDRVKHNEEKIVNAIETLSKITPKKYFKTSELYDANHDFDLDSNGNPIDDNGKTVSCSVEAGVIAQEVLGVDELKFTVTPESKDEEGNISAPHSLNYNSLFTYAIAAIQEQQTMIEDLRKEIEQLKS